MRARHYLRAVIAGDRKGVAAVVTEALEAGLDVPTLLLEVMAPALRAVGEGWHNGELSMAQEHWATEATLEELERVRRVRVAQRTLDLSVVVAVPEGEAHVLPARFVATLLEGRGWRVDFLGGAMPVDELTRYVRERAPDAVALSVTEETRLAAAAASVAALASLDPAPALLVGGAACASLTADLALGADVVTTDALDGIGRLEAHLGAREGRGADAAGLLIRVGARAREARHRLGLSQSEVAARASLTRPYVSAVERGGQNVSLETLHRLAVALEVSLIDLLHDAR